MDKSTRTRLRELAEKATKLYRNPAHVYDKQYSNLFALATAGELVAQTHGPNHDADALYLVAACNSVLPLLDEVERLEKGLAGGVGAIASERLRQVEVEGWTPEHDDEHDGNQMAMAAACYASPVPLNAQIEVPCGCREAMCQHSAFGKHMWVDAWPWDVKWDKRKKHDRRKQLAIAGALIAAELDRLDRAEAALRGREREAK